MEDVTIIKQVIIQRTGRKLIVEVVKEDDSVCLVSHFDNKEPNGIRLSRESLLYMLQALEHLDFEVEAVEGKTAVVTYEIP